MADQTPPRFGRTPWDVLLELTRRRSFLVWACLVGWGALAAAVAAWHYNLLPTRGTSTAGSSDYLHWSIARLQADESSKCRFASLSAQNSSGATEVEVHDEAPDQIFVVGVDGPFVSAIGWAGTLSLLFVAGPEQTKTHNKQAQLRKLLSSHLRSP